MKKNFKVSNVDCGHCGQKIQEGIEKLSYVNKCDYNFIRQKMTVDFEDGMAELVLSDMKKIGKKIERDFEVEEV